MVAIHPRFRAEMLARLAERLGNATGDVAVWGGELDYQHQFGSNVNSVTHIDNLDDRCWDSLVCVAELWRLEDLTLVKQALTAHGRLFFVEPVVGYGLNETLHRQLRAIVRRRYGFTFGTDVPRALRAAGLTPTSTDRFRVGRIRYTFAAGEARCYQLPA